MTVTDEMFDAHFRAWEKAVNVDERTLTLLRLNTREAWAMARQEGDLIGEAVYWFAILAMTETAYRKHERADDND